MLKIIKFFKKKKFTLFVVSLVLLSFIVNKPIQAFSTPTRSSHFLFDQAVFGTNEMNLQSFVFETFKATGSSVVSLLFGCITCSSEEREKNPGFIASAAGIVSGIYAHPPASGIRYFANLGNQLGIVKTAYAQGMGFRTFETLRPIWKVFRDFSYVFFVLFFIFVGFAIMFRAKINPQTVVTIQSALPKVILALILVTFSYAIVGFLVDIGIVLIYLIHSLFKNVSIVHLSVPIKVGGITFQDLTLKMIIEELLDPLFNIFGASGTPLNLEVVITAAFFLFMIPCWVFGMFVVLGPLGWLLQLLIIVLVLIALIRVVWTLLRAYALIIINLILGPFIILTGLLPGSDSISNWFKNLIANILVLPATFAMLFISSFLTLTGIMGTFMELTKPLLETLLWLIPGYQTPVEIDPVSAILQFFSAQNVINIFNLLILPIVGIIIFLLTPKVADIIKGFVTKQPFGYGTAIGQAFGPITTPTKAAAGLGWGYVQKLVAPSVEKGARKRLTPTTAETESGEITEDSPEG